MTPNIAVIWAIALMIIVALLTHADVTINIKHTQIFRDDTPDPDLFDPDDPSGDWEWEEDDPPEELDVVAMNHQEKRPA